MMTAEELEKNVKFIPCPCSYGICDECLKNGGEYNPAIDLMVRSMESHRDAARRPQMAPEDIPFE